MNGALNNNPGSKPEESQGPGPEQQGPLVGDDILAQHALDEAELDSIAGGKDRKTTQHTVA